MLKRSDSKAQQAANKGGNSSLRKSSTTNITKNNSYQPQNPYGNGSRAATRVVSKGTPAATKATGKVSLINQQSKGVKPA